ncbi:hypothetical protein B0J12DRAFT_743421 [Macrophomina phaseolina]|uniref:Uncharacterized protein n=1 Tax=Macrophomina phaseolina TaxID=35725 RepID=A0ABQ8G1G9_9PEZI|nr:hypothetical protein B0J12DRAFT_743421 [Macrophomina phaseolina]
MESDAANVSWKLRANTTIPIEYLPLRLSRQFFAVDASGSTAGSIIRTECDFVKGLTTGHPDDLFATWGSYCDNPTSDLSHIQWEANRGGTHPSHILSNPAALDAIAKSDLWYLLTDGEIWERDVGDLCRLALDTGVLNVPVIFVITGGKSPSPSDLNISVGISFFANAPDCLILFKQNHAGHIYVIAAKGCFASLANGNGQAVPDLESWAPLKRLEDEERFIDHCNILNIQIPSAASRAKFTSGAVSLGQEWERHNAHATVDLDLLFTAAGVLGITDLEQLLADEAFKNLSVACKTRGRIQDCRSFLLTQKIEEINLKLEDISGAADIVQQLNDPGLHSEVREKLQHHLREAHANNRRYYQESLMNLRDSGQHQETRKRNQLVNHALERLADLEKSGYTADILARRSNRARRAATVPPGGEISISSLDLDTPNAFRGECRICCGENEVMSIAIKAGADGAANTDNFALDFPLAAGRSDANRDLVASQHVCFQCALAFGGRSLFREDLAAIVPTLDCDGTNKKYICEQLHTALTGGLRTGASGVFQLFMTLLDRTLREKEWAGAGIRDSEDPEVIQRRAMLQWVLGNLLQRTQCRETFSELGRWVSYREALLWAAKDFRAQGVDSWAVGYPIAGFMQLLSFGEKVGAFDEDTVRDLRLTKLLHSVASAYLALLFKNAHTADQAWKQPLLELIYAHFNTDLVPTDKRGPESLVNSTDAFWSRISTWLRTDAELLARWHPADKERALRRVQLLAFWLVYHQRAHTRTKTFFQTLRITQPISLALLDPSGPALPPAITHPVLLSIFRGPDTTPTHADHTFLALHAPGTTIAPFATPFGPSVLRCSFPACAAPFFRDAATDLPRADARWPDRQRDALRQARAAHLVRAFAADVPAFARAAPTGMPAVTASPAPPLSTHYNLHASVARVWARAEREVRRRVARGEEPAVGAFVAEVSREICEGGRGDVFHARLDQRVVEVLPSFVEALRVALRREGRDGEAVEVFEHDWEKNRLEAKVRYEMEVCGIGAGAV